MSRARRLSRLPGFRRTIALLFVGLLGVALFVGASYQDSQDISPDSPGLPVAAAAAAVGGDAERSERFAREMFDASGGRLTQAALASLTAGYACFRRGERATVPHGTFHPLSLLTLLVYHELVAGLKRVYGTEDGRRGNGGAREWGDRAAWKKARWIYRVEEQIHNGSTTPVADALKLCGVKSSTQLRGQQVPNAKYVELMSKIQRWRQEPTRTHILNCAAGVCIHDVWCVLCVIFPASHVHYV
jgi:hypothetical protein|eukprot:COSAG01_NODE_7235_length_3290_cov_17.200877_2_plen_244_part_00